MSRTGENGPPDAAPAVVDTGGRLPVFRDHSVVFVANLLGLFFGNEIETRALAAEVGQIDSYGGRLLPVLDLLYQGGGNLLLLERAPDPELGRYFSDVLGLSVPEVGVLRHADYERLGRELRQGPLSPASEREIASLGAHPARWMDGYVVDETLSLLADRTGKRAVSGTEASRRGNNKLLLHRFLEGAGLPVFETVLAGSPADVPACMRELRRRGYRDVVLKSQIGASGIGTRRLPVDEADRPLPREDLDLFFYEGECMVQGWLGVGHDGISEVRSPSVQLFLDERSVHLYDLTEQILSRESIHEGNESPPSYLPECDGLREELFRQAGIAGCWLHGEGFRGTASVDFVVALRPGKPPAEGVHVCEINARVTGATYPSVLARRFHPGGAWLMRNLRFSESREAERLLAALERRRCLFHGDEPAGVLPVNFNPGPDGLVEKGQFLCLGRDPAECERFLDFAEHGLPIDWEYVRD